MKKAQKKGVQAAAKAPAAKKLTSDKKGPITNQIMLNAENPIPLDNGGMAFSFVNGYAYLPFLAPDDNYAKMLLQARLNSVTHNACIRTKKNYCGGIGFQDAESRELPKEMLDWFKSMNLKNEPVSKVNKKIFESKFTWGNAPIELVKFTVKGEKRLFVYTHDLQEWRLGNPDDHDIVQYSLYSKLFRRDGFVTADQIKKARKIPIYSPYNREKNNWIEENGTQRTLIWYKDEVMGVPHYGLPSSVASMINQLNEYEGACYDYDNFKNNMVAGAILALQGNVSQPEINRIGREVNKQYTGRGKRGRLMVTGSEDGLTGSSLHNLDTRKEGSYLEAKSGWRQDIILAHEWDSVLLGVLDANSLGKGSGFITKIIEEKYNKVIKPEQDDIMQNVWNTIFSIAQKWLNLPFDQYNIIIKNGIDISGLTDVDITPAVQVNEVRKAKGLPEDPKKDGVYMTEMKAKQQKGGSDVQD